MTLDHGPHSPAAADPRSDQDPNDNQDLGPAQDGGAAEKAPWPVLDDRIESGDHPGFVGFDTSRAHPARIYDYLLGGKDNFAADRRAGTQVAELAPWVISGARGNRAFLVRAVSWLAEAGIHQFLDIGSGLPGPRNVHEVAQAVNPHARTVYVDNDDLVLVHARALLARDARTIAVAGDARDPAAILADPEVRAQLDLERPLAVLLVAVLHFIVDQDQAAGIVANLRDRLAPGSYLVISHVADLPDTIEHPDRAAATHAAVELYNSLTAPFFSERQPPVSRWHPKREGPPQGTVGRREALPPFAGAGFGPTRSQPDTGGLHSFSQQVTLRSREQVTALFDGFELVQPGVVAAHEWRPDRGRPGPAIPVLAGIGHLPCPAAASASRSDSAFHSFSDPDSHPGPDPAPVRGPGGAGMPGQDRATAGGDWS